MKYPTQLVNLSLGSILVLSGNIQAEVIAVTNHACYNNVGLEPLDLFVHMQEREKVIGHPSSERFFMSTEDYENYKQDFDYVRRITFYKPKGPKDIHIDIQRPSTGKIGTPTIYDASGSTVPSGKPAFKWAPVTGGVTFENTDQKITTVTAKPASDSGLNAITTLTVTDTVCDIDDTVQFNVNYKP
jgi:hypothetical protein